MSDTEDRSLAPMDIGLRVDVLDNEGIWNTGVIVDVSRDDEDMVEIKYDGWGDEYNEWIPLSAERLAPLHMFTMVKKCWAKLTKWPWWPAFVVLRAPTRKSAADALNTETKLYVEFFDSYVDGKRSRCWMQKKNVASFQEGFDERASKNIGKNFPEYVEGAQRSIAGGSPVLFSGNGTLPIEFSSKYAEPLASRMKSFSNGDDDKWFDAYRIFSDRYRLLYGLDFAHDPTSKLMAAQQAKHAKTVQGKRAPAQKNAAAGEDDEEDEEDDDEVEIIESPGKQQPKRGRGRPAGKHAKKQPKVAVYADDEDQEDEEEENDEEPSCGKRKRKGVDEDEYNDSAEAEDEEDEEEEEEEEAESPRGRRSARVTNKRKPMDETPPRSTRPRRTTREGEDEEEEKDESDEYECGQDHSASSSPTHKTRQPANNYNNVEHKRTALAQLLASAPPQRTLVARPATTIRSKTYFLPSKELIHELGKAIEAQEDTSPSSDALSDAAVAKSSSRRKSSNPQARTSPTRPSTEETASGTSTSSAQDRFGLRHWLGFGAIEESSHQPFAIQAWLLNGFRRKRQSEGKSTTNVHNDDV